ncbi:MAG: hypothetical protein R3E68_00785 [Burkholderiaceae bacterium]
MGDWARPLRRRESRAWHRPASIGGRQAFADTSEVDSDTNNPAQANRAANDTLATAQRSAALAG